MNTKRANQLNVHDVVRHFRSVYYGHGKKYNAHGWIGGEITSDSLRNIKRAAKSLGWPCADISREDGTPEWITRDGRHACETYLWMPRRVPNSVLDRSEEKGGGV